MKKKLKLDKSFAPSPSDDGDEFFANGIFEFNITKLQAYVAGNSERFQVEAIEVAQFHRYDPTTLDPETIKTADLSNPILLAEIAPGRFNVIDGNHRLERARRDGITTLPAYRVTPEHHVAFLTTTRGYEAYVKYWNSKLEDER